MRFCFSARRGDPRGGWRRA